MAGEIASCPAPNPVPERGTLMLIGMLRSPIVVKSPPFAPNEIGRLGAMTETEPATEITPVIEPPATGLKLTPKRTLCPGRSTSGVCKPDRENPFPATEARVITTEVLPGLDNTADCDWALPITTLPKPIAVGVRLRRPVGIAVPLKVNVVGKRNALLARTTLPCELPPLFGE